MRTANCKVSVLDDVGDPDAAPGSEPWAKWMLGQAKLRRSDLDRDATGLQAILAKLEKHSAWKVLGFESLGRLCRNELQLDEKAVELLRAAKPGVKLRAVLEAKVAKPLAKHGEIGNGRSRGAVSTSKRGSTSAEYLAARIARDRPDVLKRMKAGEFKSVRDAAIEAGIVKKATRLDSLKSSWNKATPAERKAFLAFIGRERP